MESGLQRKNVESYREENGRVKQRTLASLRSTDPVTGAHGYAMLSMTGSELMLYDSFAAKTMTLSTKDFRDNFTAVLWQEL